MFKIIAVLVTVFVSGAALACHTPAKIEGSAMMPSFRDGDRILVDTNFGELKRGDVILFKYPKDPSKVYVKRILGLPGEKIEISNGVIFIDGKAVDEPYIDPDRNQNDYSMPAKLIPVGEYFVLGDNRDNSSDSRYWGNVRQDLINGKHYYTYTAAGDR